jgi:hypothetical protein
MEQSGADNFKVVDSTPGAQRESTPDLVGFCSIFVTFWAIYAVSGCYRFTPYNAHVYLSYSMLHGRFDLIDPPGHFELIRSAGRAYIAYGIGPSLLMLPFVACWGLDFHQALFSATLAAIAVSYWWSILGLLDFKGSERAWLTTLFGFGSLFWFYAGRNGSSWSLTQVATVFGLMLAIHEMVGRQRGWLIGLGFKLAVLSRQPVLLSLPFFIGELARQKGRKAVLNSFSFFLTLGGLALFDAYYNYARFGSPFENGYKLLVMNSLDVGPHSWGLFNIKYVPQNIRLYFLTLPSRLQSFPWFDPGLGGLSILLTTPALFLSIGADYRDRFNWLALYCCVAIQGFYLTYYGTGYSQFGCRYSMDYLPFVMLLAAAGAKRFPRWMLRTVTLAGIIVEIWGIGWSTYRGL